MKLICADILQDKKVVQMKAVGYRVLIRLGVGSSLGKAANDSFLTDEYP